jgi:hypothetical protein
MRGSRVVPAGNPGKQTASWVVLVALAAGCGGGHGATKLVGGTGYSFSAPASWTVVRGARQVEVVAGSGSRSLVRVSRLPLLRAFQPSLWPRVVPELDRAAAALARQQNGRVTAARDVTVAGQRARRYDIGYELEGRALVETIAFVLRVRTEYFLLCRYERGTSSSACGALFSSFRLT